MYNQINVFCLIDSLDYIKSAMEKLSISAGLKINLN